MEIDSWKAREAFERYLDEYNREDEKIKLKIVHTYGVVACTREIAKRMKLSKEDVQLAELIALLHDIGRFEQLKRFDSFQPDTMNHALYGAFLLFGDMAGEFCGENKDAAPETAPMIRRFLKEEKYDRLICEAISRHSDFELGEIKNEHVRLHAKLIRDADKLDNCRVKLEESIEAMLGMSREEAGKGYISPKVWEACRNQKSVLSSDRISGVDYWVSYIAQFFDINFPETWEIIREHNYIPAIVSRLHYQEPDTQKKMAALTAQLQSYMEEQIDRKNKKKESFESR